LDKTSVSLVVNLTSAAENIAYSPNILWWIPVNFYMRKEFGPVIFFGGVRAGRTFAYKFTFKTWRIIFTYRS
jgi:hypothetical protein